MTSEEIGLARDSGKTTILIPTGGTEQNGRHMVTGKHNIIVAETATRVARALGDALVAPVIGYTPEGDIASRSGHMALPGTISLRPQTFAAVLEDAAHSFAVHGFRTIVFLGDSGPNQAVQASVAGRLSRAWQKRGVRVVHAAGYYAQDAQMRWLRDRGLSEDEIGTHAGVRDTSELLSIKPTAVRREMLSVRPLGSDGAPARASAAFGDALIGLKVRAAVSDIRAAVAAENWPVAGRDEGGPGAAADAPEGFWQRLWRAIVG